MTFLNGFYFMLVTMSSVGYGDYYPLHPLVRAWLMVTLVGYVVVLSNDLTKLAHSLQDISEFDTEHRFEQHLIVIGTYRHNYLRDFIRNLFADINRDPVLKAEIKCIIIGDDEPTLDLERIIYDMELEGKIYYLRCPLLDSSCFSKANIGKAKAVYAFVDRHNENLNAAVYLLMKDLHFRAPHVELNYFIGNGEVQAVNTKELKEELHAKAIKNNIMGTMVLNKGI